MNLKNENIIVRLDDFPHGDKIYWKTQGAKCYTAIAYVLKAFNKRNIPYIIGASPLLFSEYDYEFLNQHVISGYVVLHGFNHGFDYEPWSCVRGIWKDGGEFRNKSEDELESTYKHCDLLLKRVGRYNDKHFIPPFNIYTQNLVNVLSRHGVKYLYCCDKEIQDYKLDKLDLKGMELFSSKLGKTYNYVEDVIRYMDGNKITEDEMPFTFHWCYDMTRRNYVQKYEEFAERIKNGI